MASFQLHGYGLAGSIAFILFLVADLDNPFWGDWIVTPDPIRKALERRLAPQDQAAEQTESRAAEADAERRQS